jgi:hypothetical protein
LTAKAFHIHLHHDKHFSLPMHIDMPVGEPILFANQMKTMFTAICAIGIAVAQTARADDLTAGELKSLTKKFVIPRIDYKDAYGIEVLEFLRLKIWTTIFEEKTVEPAHEYRCNPERLFTKIDFKRDNVKLGEALNEITKQLNIDWKIEKGRIVFTDVVAPKNEDANRVPGSS